jgi:hypothetical protein
MSIIMNNHIHFCHSSNFSCGSGGFLLHALDKVRKQADEFFPDGIAIDKKEESAQANIFLKNFFIYFFTFFV